MGHAQRAEFNTKATSALGRPQLTTPGDCLSKTQLCAKAKADVYRVTLVQCWNVNGWSGLSSDELRRPEAPVNDGSNYKHDSCSYKIWLFAGNSDWIRHYQKWWKCARCGPLRSDELRTTNGQSAGNLGNQRVLRGHTSDPPKLRKMLAERYGPISWATMRLSDGELIESIETNKKDELSKSR